MITDKFTINFSFVSMDAVKGFKAIEISKKLDLTPVSILHTVTPKTFSIKMDEKHARKLQGKRIKSYPNYTTIDFSEENEIHVRVGVEWEDLTPREVKEIWRNEPDNINRKYLSGYEFDFNSTWEERFIESEV